ncbi:hypothetical protein GPB2148_2508 [marine gamma proteobacterium HTCC2148]|nr:hypothetical protein GPB2148_2508 [marine gamma proteobacterium HTCC2148]
MVIDWSYYLWLLRITGVLGWLRLLNGVGRLLEICSLIFQGQRN